MLYTKVHSINIVSGAVCAVLLSFAATASTAFAESSEKLLLDKLVQKGVLTPEESMNIAKQSTAAVAVTPDKKTKSVRVGARFQTQYEYIDSNFYAGAGSPVDQSNMGFIIRRLFIQTEADLGGGWEAKAVLDMARSESTSYLNDVYVSKKFDYEYFSGKLYAGYMKPGLSYEDALSTFALDAVETSAVTNYWTCPINSRRLGVGNRYTGLRWNGNVKQVEGLTYILAVTNSYQLSPTAIANADNRLAYWGSVHYAKKIDGVSLKGGVYTMYSSEANSSVTPSSSIYTVSPYITLNYGGWYIWSSYTASGVENGKTVGGSYAQANPYGVDVSIEYRFDVGEFGKIAPIFKYSWIDTNGRGVQMSDVQRHATSVGGSFNNVQEFYGGINWYLRGEDLKLQIGYSYMQFSGTPSDKNADYGGDAGAFRMQLQVKM